MQEGSFEKKPHTVVLKDRSDVAVTGVRAINHYDELEVSLYTDLGTLVLGGKEIKVSELSVDSGEVKVSGNIEYLQYIEKAPKEKGLLKGLFR